MRIGIVGTGGVGGLVGGFLARNGNDVALLARGAHRDALRDHGLRFEGTRAEFSVKNFAVSDQGSELGICEVVFVSVKTFQLEAALPHLHAMVGEGTVVVPLLNGIVAWDLLAARLGEERVVGGNIYVNSWVDSPGVIKQTGALIRLMMGERTGGVSPRLHAINELLISAGISGELEADVLKRNWEKFLGFEPMALVGALSRSSIGAFRTQPGTRAVLVALMKEVASIGRRKGVDFGEDAVELRMEIIDSLAHDATISMQRDIMRGRPSEFMEQSIGLVSLAKSLGVEVPVHDVCVPMLLLQEQAARTTAGKAS